jgi:hypothetical protein
MRQHYTPWFLYERMVGGYVGFAVDDVQTGGEYCSFLQGLSESVRVDDGTL